MASLAFFFNNLERVLVGLSNSNAFLLLLGILSILRGSNKAASLATP
jgi:hypothetical protein